MGCASVTTLGLILKATKNLTHFSYTYIPYFLGRRILSRRLLEALNHISPTLEELNLRGTTGDCTVGFGLFFLRFKKPRKLTVSRRWLAGTSRNPYSEGIIEAILPPALECLVLFNYAYLGPEEPGKLLNNCFILIRARKGGRLPRSKALSVNQEYGKHPKVNETWKPCEEAGLELTVGQ